MPYDPKTGRLFTAVSTPPNTEGMVFDTKTKEAVRFYKNQWKHKYLSNSFPNGDRSFTVVIETPGVGFYRWDPETLEVSLMRDFPPEDGRSVGSGSLLIDGKFYISGKGWYDPIENRIREGIKPDTEGVWRVYDPEEGAVYGTVSQDSDSTVVKWNTATGEVSKLYTIKNCYAYTVSFTKDFNAVAVNLYGYFYRINLKEKSLEVCSRLETDEYGRTDCIMRVDDKTLLGTPLYYPAFLDRTWKREKDDCGRVASAGGQVNLTWNMDGIVYMACYTPENWRNTTETAGILSRKPYVVVYSPKPAMRPVAGVSTSRAFTTLAIMNTACRGVCW